MMPEIINAFAVSLLLFLTLQRLGELLLARRNTAALLDQGGHEVGADHYFLLVTLHTLWLISLWAFGYGAEISVPLLFAFLALQLARVWVIASLGNRWTTRIIVMPGEPLVAAGPFKYIRHPNYCVVVAEIAIVPLMFGLPLIAVVFTVANALVLAKRISVENTALSPARSPA
ncbi:MAG: isoprenylcysteine carboxylmethyltransferase family protein [Pseudomonadota bacterium]